jgi:hypothetical protein
MNFKSESETVTIDPLLDTNIPCFTPCVFKPPCVISATPCVFKPPCVISATPVSTGTNRGL